jgi:hypothetical protein
VLPELVGTVTTTSPPVIAGIWDTDRNPAFDTAVHEQLEPDETVTVKARDSPR